MGKRSIEERILEEGSFLLVELRKTEGQEFFFFFLNRLDGTILAHCSLDLLGSSSLPTLASE